MPNKNLPNKYVAAALGIVFGTVGLHQIYLRHNAAGIIWLISAIVLSWTVVVPVILAVVGFAQGVTYLFWPDPEWEKRFS